MKREDRRTLGGGGHPILCVRSVEMPALQDRVRRTENNNEAAISVFIKWSCNHQFELQIQCY